MKKNPVEQAEGHVSLAAALNELHEQTVRVQDDMKRVLGILDGIKDAKNVYDLQHRLKSLIGRERSTTRMLRRWVALLEPLEVISESIG